LSLVAAATEMMSAVRFLEELRRIPRYGAQLPAGDPLAAAVKFVELNPAYSQSRLLTRVLAALAGGAGEFRRAEIAAFDTPTLAMVIRLMDVHAVGGVTGKAWQDAAAAAVAAQRNAGG